MESSSGAPAAATLAAGSGSGVPDQASFGDLQGTQAAVALAAALHGSGSQQQQPQAGGGRRQMILQAGTEGGEPEVLTLVDVTPVARCAIIYCCYRQCSWDAALVSVSPHFSASTLFAALLLVPLG